MTAMNEDPGMDAGHPEGENAGDTGHPAADRPDTDLSAELRRRLQHAVADIRPAPDALDRLQEAVPARRRRRRATMLTTAATVVVLAVATPVVRTVVITDQTTQQSGVNAHSSTDVGSGDDQGDGEDQQSQSEDRGRSGAVTSGGLTGSGGGRNTSSPGATSSPSPSASPSYLLPPAAATSPVPGAPQLSTGPGSITATATVEPTPPAPTAPPAVPPACDAAVLEQKTGTLGDAGPDGIAYGVVEVRNTSRQDCSIDGSGHMMVATPPGNAPIQVTVRVHKAGDPAARLPQVPPPAGPLTLRAGASYEFQFAWQPKPGTGVNGSCTPGDNPPGPPPPEPALVYALADGDVKIAEVRLTAACGGEVYRTDVYAAGAHPRVG